MGGCGARDNGAIVAMRLWFKIQATVFATKSYSSHCVPTLL